MVKASRRREGVQWLRTVAQFPLLRAKTAVALVTSGGQLGSWGGGGELAKEARARASQPRGSPAGRLAAMARVLAVRPRTAEGVHLG